MTDRSVTAYVYIKLAMSNLLCANVMSCALLLVQIAQVYTLYVFGLYVFGIGDESHKIEWKMVNAAGSKSHLEIMLLC